MTRQHRQRTLVRCSDIEGPDDPVDARGGDDGVAVFVPVVRQGFRRRNAGGGGQTGPGARRGMYGDGKGEVVGRGGGGAEIEDAEVGVGGDGGEEGGGVGGVGGAVGAGVGGEGEDGGRPLGGPL